MARRAPKGRIRPFKGNKKNIENDSAKAPEQVASSPPNAPELEGDQDPPRQSGGGSVFDDMDFGELLKENLNLIVAVFIVTAVAVAGYGVYQYRSHSQLEQHSELIYSFREEKLEKFEQGEMEKEVLVAQFNQLQAEVDRSLLYPVMMEVAEVLVEKKHLKAALDLLQRNKEHFMDEDSKALFIRMHLAVLYEDLGQNKLALEVLKKLRDQDLPVLKEKVYFDIGRLSMQSGDLSQAQKSFDHLVDNFPQGQWTALAWAYKQKLAQQK